MTVIDRMQTAGNAQTAEISRQNASLRALRVLRLLLRRHYHSCRLVVVFLALSSSAASAQTPPRPGEATRAVTLSLAEYNRLLDLAARPAAGPPAAPVASVLSGANLRVRVERDTARGVFTLTGQVLRAGISRVNLISGATLMEASVGGRPLPLAADGNAQAAFVPGPGPFSLSLEWGAPLVYAPGRASFTLPVPKSGTARATIDLPGDQADVHLSTGLITQRAVASGRTIVEATLEPGAATEVWWSMRDSAPVAAARDVRMLADVMTLVTLGDADVRMAALVDVAVVQGEPGLIEAHVPAGYEVTGVSGSSLESSDTRDGAVMLRVSDSAVRRHQFLISLERQHEGGSFTLDTGVVTIPDAQRERGEIAVEGIGTLELTAIERDGMQRLDVRELDKALQSLARLPILAAFRYQRATAPLAALTLGVKRFSDSGVLAAIADRAEATTLVTTEGRALTEVVLTVQNRAQPFLKVTLPPGASIVSVDVAGESAKPVAGADGTRVPLLRPGFRPNGPYTVTFVYLHAGAPFAKKGEMQMALPKMDIPVGIVEWEVFVPENYSVRAFDGNVIDRLASPQMRIAAAGVAPGAMGGVAGGVVAGLASRADAAHLPILPGQIRGRVTDSIGEALPGVTIALDSGRSHQSTVTGADGTYVLSIVPSGTVTVSAQLAGFRASDRSFTFDQRPRQVDFALAVGNLDETVTVSAESPKMLKETGTNEKDQKPAPPPQTVVELQRRTAGVLPVRVDVPRAGTSHQFVKPLLVDQEATVRFKYKRR
jgi:hypothetical protein